MQQGKLGQSSADSDNSTNARYRAVVSEGMWWLEDIVIQDILAMKEKKWVPGTVIILLSWPLGCSSNTIILTLSKETQDPIYFRKGNI